MQQHNLNPRLSIQNTTSRQLWIRENESVVKFNKTSTEN